MSDAVKWALAASITLALLITVLTFPFVSLLPEGATELKNILDSLVANRDDITSFGYYLYQARGFLNMFLTSFGIKLLNVLIVYFFTSWILKITIKITSWIFHFIFK